MNITVKADFEGEKNPEKTWRKINLDFEGFVPLQVYRERRRKY